MRIAIAAVFLICASAAHGEIIVIVLDSHGAPIDVHKVLIQVHGDSNTRAEMKKVGGAVGKFSTDAIPVETEFVGVSAFKTSDVNSAAMFKEKVDDPIYVCIDDFQPSGYCCSYVPCWDPLRNELCCQMVLVPIWCLRPERPNPVVASSITPRFVSDLPKYMPSRQRSGYSVRFLAPKVARVIPSHHPAQNTELHMADAK